MSDPFSKYEKKPADPFAKYESGDDPFAKYSAAPSPDYGKLEEEATEFVGSLKPVGGPSKEITEEELAAIAREKNLTPEQLSTLRRSVPFLAPGQGFARGIGRESIREGALAAAGTAGKFALGVPQKLYRVAQDQNLEEAMDLVESLGSRRASVATELLPSIGGLGAAASALTKSASLVKPAVTAAKAAGIGAGVGAVEGATGAWSGNELLGAGIGAAAGGILTGAGSAIASRALRKEAAAESVKEMSEAATRKSPAAKELAEIEPEINVAEIAAPRIADYRQADDIAEEAIFNPAKVISKEEADTLLSKYAPALQDIDKVGKELTTAQEAAMSQYKSLVRKANEKQSDNLPLSAFESEILTNPPKGYKQVLGKYGKQLASRGVLDDLADDFRTTLPGNVPQNLRGVDMVRRLSGMTEGSGAGEDYARKTFREHLNTNHVNRAIQDRGVIDTAATGFGGRMANFLSDAQYVLAHVDDRYGTGFSKAHKKLGELYNKMSVPREAFRKKLTGIYDSLRGTPEADAAAVNGTEIIRALENLPKDPGQLSRLDKNQQKALAAFQRFFMEGLEDISRLAKEAGLPPLDIKARANYIRSQWAEAPVLASRVTGKLAEIAQAAGKKSIDDVSSEDIARLARSSKEMAETLGFINKLVPGEGLSGAALKRGVTQMFSGRQGRIDLQNIASSAMERSDEIPLWARETNLYKLGESWYNSTLRSLYLRQSLQTMRQQARVLDNLGATRDANYVRNLIQDITGIRQNTWGEAATAASERWLFSMDQKIAAASNPAIRAALEVQRAIPATVEYLLRQVYPNLLGTSLRAAVMNSTQTFTKTLPEFGTGYGASLFLRGAANMRASGRLLSDEELIARGFMPSAFVSGGKPYLREGLARTEFFRKSAIYLDKAADVSMWLYQRMETVNRNIALQAANTLASDLLGPGGINKRLAVRSLGKFDRSLRREAQQAIDSGDAQALQDILATHIINRTQYQYNRANMSEMGRTMGPLFATFSKWPTATLGQVLYEFRSKGLGEGTQRLFSTLFAPLALLQTADFLIAEGAGGEGQLNPLAKEEGFSDRQARVLSGSGLSQSSPVGNLVGISTGDFFTPPAIDTLLRARKGLDQVADGDVSGLLDAGANAAYMFAPGGVGGYLRFLTDDLATLLSGERPGGRNFVERIPEGARVLSRELK